MNNNNADDCWLIWSYEHDAWWGPGAWGYTRELAEAGRYDRGEADRIVARANVVKVNEVAVPLAEAAAFPPAMTDDALIAMASAAIKAREQPIEIVLRPASAFQLAALLQLALRHPHIDRDKGSTRTAIMFIEHVRAYFMDAPAILEMLRRGEDPAHDQAAVPRLTMRLRYRPAGRHVHCRLFSAHGAKHGELTFDEREWPLVYDTLRQIMDVVDEDLSR